MSTPAALRTRGLAEAGGLDRNAGLTDPLDMATSGPLGEIDRLRGNDPLGWNAAESEPVTRPDVIPEAATRAVVVRKGASHRGIAARHGLRALVAMAVNQDFLDEICELSGLEYLHLGDPVTAEDLSGIARLGRLRTLKLDGVRKARDFSPLLAPPGLRILTIGNAPGLRDLDFLADAHQLASIGVEGDIWTAQKIESLRPLGGLRELEALFHTNVVLRDKELSYLADCPKLRILRCARFAPKRQFEALRRLMPDLRCEWCDRYEID